MISKTFQNVKKLIGNKEVLISSHGYDELAEDEIYVSDIIININFAKVIEDYPDKWSEDFMRRG